MKLLLAEEVAEKLKVKASWVHDRTRARCPEEEKIPCIRLGRYVRFDEAEISAWIARGCRPEGRNLRPLKAVNEKETNKR